MTDHIYNFFEELNSPSVRTDLRNKGGEEEFELEPGIRRKPSRWYDFVPDSVNIIRYPTMNKTIVNITIDGKVLHWHIEE